MDVALRTVTGGSVRDSLDHAREEDWDLRCQGRCFCIWTGILVKVLRKGLRQCEISNATTHYEVGEQRFRHTLCSLFSHLFIEDEREQSAMLCLVGS